jgi:hypothetical protein
VNIFDLIFLASAVATAITLAVAAISALRGRGARAFRILRAYGICAVCYSGIA